MTRECDAEYAGQTAGRIESEFGRLDLLVNNAAISMVERNDVDLQSYVSFYGTSVVSLDKVRAIWETNVFGQLAVYQAMLRFCVFRMTRIVNVESGAGSLALNASSSFPYRKMFDPAYQGRRPHSTSSPCR